MYCLRARALAAGCTLLAIPLVTAFGACDDGVDLSTRSITGTRVALDRPQ
jgi:hypothetical protein